MTAFVPVPHVSGTAAPLLRANVDTDAIIPSREIKGVGKTGLADGLFAGWRYAEPGGREPNPDFVLNRPEFADAPILIGGANFGCGSSREHAVWALHEYGFRAVIAPSFAPIFRGNCIRNGVIPVELNEKAVSAIAEIGGTLDIDLAARRVCSTAGEWTFAIEDEAATMLAEGLDAIDLTLRYADAIADFHRADRSARPWIYLKDQA